MSGLARRRVVVTRAPHQAGKLVELLEARGAVALRYPCIDIEPPQDTGELDAALGDLATFDWLVLTSANTVYALGKRLAEMESMPHWSQVSVAAVGPKTAQAAREVLGIRADLIPETFTAESLGAELEFEPGTKVLFPQAEIGRDTLVNALELQGANVCNLTAYRTVIGSGGDSLAGGMDALTFTSPSTVDNFALRWQNGGSALDSVLEIPAACIGPVTAEAAARHGYRRIITPESDYTLAGMVAALESYFGEL